MTKEEKKYYKKLKRYRTSLLRFIWLIITSKMPLKLALFIYRNPIEIMHNEGDIKREELLTTEFGLRIIKVYPDDIENQYRFLFITPSRKVILWTQLKFKNI